MATQAVAKTNGISSKDRQELRRIVKARFQILQAELRRREQEVRELVREKLEKEAEEAVEAAEAEHEALQKEVEALSKKALKFLKSAKKAGAEPAAWRPYQEREAKHPVVFMIPPRFGPAEVEKQINREVEKLSIEKGRLDRTLELQELDLMEELATGALGTEAAKTFLGRIPTLDEVLPLPEGPTKTKQLSK